MMMMHVQYAVSYVSLRDLILVQLKRKLNAML